MSKPQCVTIGCKNAPVDGSRCAIHGGVISLGLEDPQYVQGGGETKEGETFTAEEGIQPDDVAVNGKRSTGKPKKCKALTKAGKPCKSPSVGPDGYCATHSGRAGFGTVEVARKGAEASAKARRERVEARARRLEDAKLGLADLLRLRALERKEELVAALIDAAVQGRDVPALRVVFDRLEGRVSERVELTDGLTPEELAMVKRSREYAKLTTMSDSELHARIEGDQ